MPTQMPNFMFFTDSQPEKETVKYTPIKIIIKPKDAASIKAEMEERKQ